MKRLSKITSIWVAIILMVGCTAQKKKGDISPLAKLYHNTTAHYNGYFNAEELLAASVVQLDEQYQDNYNKILPIYPYREADNPKAVADDLDNAIKKVSVVVSLHRVSDWTDDCYLLMGKAQYVKQDFESAEETLEYMVEEYSPEAMAKRKAEASKGKKGKKKKGKKGKKKKKKKKSSKKSKKKKKKSQAQKRKEYNKNLKKKKKGKSSSKKEETPKSSTKETPKKSSAKSDKKKEETKAAANVEDENYFLKHKPAYWEALLWLSRVYIERDQPTNAERLMSQLESDSRTPKEVQRELAAARAYFVINKKEYNSAIPYLEKAITLEKNRSKKARYAFIIAQIHEKNGEADRAYAGYERVLKYSSEYEMAFRARLSLAQSAYLNGTSTAEAAIKNLNKMLKDVKNEEYKDQIYFTLAEIALKNGDKPEGIKNLRLALKSGSKNNNQKIEAYLLLAKLYYDDESYVDSKYYYDSTLQVMTEADERYFEVKSYAENLADIAKNIEIITLQDSLLKISDMTMEEKTAVAIAIKKKQDEERRKEIARKAKAGKGSANPRGLSSAGAVGSRPSPSNLGGSSQSVFFAYDDRAIRQGKKEFLKNWGGRPLEDDWRRSNNREVITEGEEKEEAPTTYDLTPEEVIGILKDVPANAAQKQDANDELMEAMYQLGTLYRDKLEQNEKCIATLEAMLKRYPESVREPEALYYLHLANKDLNNSSVAKMYYDKLVSKYPDSNYARILSDPDYIAKMKRERNKLDIYYDETYAIFTQGQYQEAYDRIMKADEQFGKGNPLQARFALLSAMSTGNLQGKEAYVAALKDVIAKYPQTPEQTRAKEMLRLLNGGELVDTSKGKNTGSGGKADISKSAFKQEDDKLHYMIVVFNNADVALNDSKAAISDYNRQFHKLDKLRISNIYLGSDTKTPIIVIRRFKTKDNAMDYYEGVLKNSQEFLPEAGDFQLYPVTQNNYREILKAKSLDGYQEFFETVYL